MPTGRPTVVPLPWRVRYDKTTDAISDRSPHKYAGYLTPLLPIAAASPDCQPRPLPPPKPPLLFPAPKLPFKIQLKMLQIKRNTLKPTLFSEQGISVGEYLRGSLWEISGGNLQGGIICHRNDFDCLAFLGNWTTITFVGGFVLHLSQWCVFFSVLRMKKNCLTLDGQFLGVWGGGLGGGGETKFWQLIHKLQHLNFLKKQQSSVGPVEAYLSSA